MGYRSEPGSPRDRLQCGPDAGFCRGSATEPRRRSDPQEREAERAALGSPHARTSAARSGGRERVRWGARFPAQACHRERRRFTRARRNQRSEEDGADCGPCELFNQYRRRGACPVRRATGVRARNVGACRGHAKERRSTALRVTAGVRPLCRTAIQPCQIGRDL